MRKILFVCTGNTCRTVQVMKRRNIDISGHRSRRV